MFIPVLDGQFSAGPDVFFNLGLQHVALFRLSGRQLDGLLGVDSGLQLAADLRLGVEVGPNSSDMFRIQSNSSEMMTPAIAPSVLLSLLKLAA